VVVNTHIDGVGANTRPAADGEVPAFPNARYVIAAEESAALRDGRLPGAEPLDVLLAEGVVDDPAGRVAGEVVMEPGPGHSPGHQIVRIGCESDDRGVIGPLVLPSAP